MRLYTRSGDDGSTGLFGGPRVSKDHPRVEAYGRADALNASIGMVAAALDKTTASLGECLAGLQRGCFCLGADLATPPGTEHEDKVQRVMPEDVKTLENWIDRFEGDNAPLTAFVLPGGSEVAARLHVARTAARACERGMVRLREGGDEVSDAAVQWINRCSDLLFSMARAANRLAGRSDIPWQQD